MVCEFPPKALDKILVSEEFLYGTNLFAPLEFYARIDIT